MKNRSDNLHEELKSAGASDSETKELVILASSLKQLNPGTNPLLRNAAINQKHKKWSRPIFFGLSSLAGLGIGMALVMFSQIVLPGSWLYPVQKLSDNVAVLVRPEYRGVVMMKRAEDVKQLVAKHANSHLVLATLSDYQTEASAYKSASKNYEIFEYCKSSLQQAATIAPVSERQAINNTLLKLRNV